MQFLSVILILILYSVKNGSHSLQTLIKKQLMPEKPARRIGKITQKTIPRKDIEAKLFGDVVVNNVNIYNEMGMLQEERNSIFDKYQSIITYFDKWVRQLIKKIDFLEADRLKLLGQNFELKKLIESNKNNKMCQNDIFHDTNKENTRIQLFDIIGDEDSIQHVFHNNTYEIGQKSFRRNTNYNLQENKQNRQNQILQQSDFDIPDLIKHSYNGKVQAELSISSNQQPQEQTPHLNNHTTMIQCSSKNNQSPVRIFYMLFFQSQVYISKLQEILTLGLQMSDPILPIFEEGNQLWISILKAFLEKLKYGQFEDEKQVIEYIQKNSLIDSLFIAFLKKRLPLQNQDKSINIGDWRGQLDHEKLFRALANEFDLQCQNNKEKLEYQFFQCKIKDRLKSEIEDSDKSQQMLLQSRAVSKQEQQQISLCPPQNMKLQQIAVSRQEPVFRIKYDSNKSFYRVQISIRLQPDLLETTSFRDQSSSRSYYEDSEQKSSSCNISQVAPRNINKKYNQVSSYCLQKDSNAPSYNHSFNEEQFQGESS